MVIMLVIFGIGAVALATVAPLLPPRPQYLRWHVAVLGLQPAHPADRARAEELSECPSPVQLTPADLDPLGLAVSRLTKLRGR